MTFVLSNPNNTPSSAHPDLLWQRYVEPEQENGKYGKPSLEAWDRVASFRPGKDYAAVFHRWKRILGSLPDSLLYEAKVEGRLLTGTGLASVFEASLLLHPVYGVPYLAGASVRGALRAALSTTFPQEAELLFGTEPQPSGAQNDQLSAGYVSIYDAIWVPDSSPTPVSLDVLTVHHPEYYQGNQPPTDFDQPNPVHFLTARGKFLFALQAPDAKWRDYLVKLLEDTLRYRGVGAKKAAGYGRFLPSSIPKAAAGK